MPEPRSASPRSNELFFGPGYRVGEASNPGPVWYSDLDNPEGDTFDDGADQQFHDVEDQYEACWLFNPDLEAYEPADGFAAATKFCGARAGKVFKLGDRGLGYYADYPLASTPVQQCPGPTVLKLQSLIQFWENDSARRRARRERARKRPPRAAARHKKVKPFTWCDEVEAADVAHRECGLWACDTFNSNCARQAISFLATTGADLCMFQELRTKDEHCASVEREAAWVGWGLSIEPALKTEASSSAGVGVATRSCMGMAKPKHIDDAMGTFPELAHRVQVRWVGSICKGGIFIITVYLYHTEGLSARNLDLLQALAAIISRLKGPWVLAGDFNLQPKELIASGWLLLVGGVIKAPALETCGKAVYDFFVVHKGLEKAVVGVARVKDFGMKPHCPVRLYLRAAPRAIQVRCLKAPAKIAAILPSGCAGPPVDYSAVVDVGLRNTEVATSEVLNQSCGRWLTLIEEELTGVMGLDDYLKRRAMGRAEGPRFVLKPALGLPGSPLAKTSPATEAWRMSAAWLRRIEQGFAAAGPGGVIDHGAMRARYNLSMEHWKRLDADCNSREFLEWYRMITFRDLTDCGRVQQLLCFAHDRALEQDRLDQRAALLSWRNWLGEGPASGLRRQHRVSRTSAGWVPSLIARPPDQEGDADANADVHEDDELLLCAAQEEQLEVPCDAQQTAEVSSEQWADVWQASAVPPVLDWPMDMGTPLPVPCVDAARRAMATFPVDTGLGWDRLHPRALLRLSEQAVVALLRIFILAELIGEWPAATGVVVIALLQKPQGGFRPIGLFPTLVRLWMRVRLPVAQAWQAANERAYFYAGPMKGAQVAAWKQAARAEMSRSRGLDYAAVLLDLIKAFETIPHDWLVIQARKYGFNLYLLRLSLASYKLARRIRVAGVYACEVIATRGITAGAGLATVELRLLLIEWMDTVATAHPLVKLTVYVDDVALEAMASYDRVKREIVSAAKMVHKDFTSMRLAFSDTKNVCTASKVKLAADIAMSLRFLHLKCCLRVTSLGCGLGAGVRRNAGVSRMRLRAFKARKKKFQVLRRAGVDTERLIRTGAAAGMTYGQAVMGVSDSVLLLQRRAVAATLNSAKGFGDLDVTLLLADGSYAGKADPAFQAHIEPLWFWAVAVWERWLNVRGLSRTVLEAKDRLKQSKSPWASTAGPAAAMILTAERLQWSVSDGLELTTDSGEVINLLIDSPERVKKLVGEAVWRWRWRRIQRSHPTWSTADVAHNGAAMGPIFRLLKPTCNREKWGAQERMGLRSLVTGRQWPQVRLVAAGYADSRECQFCLHDAGSRSRQAGELGYSGSGDMIPHATPPPPWHPGAPLLGHLPDDQRGAGAVDPA